MALVHVVSSPHAFGHCASIASSAPLMSDTMPSGTHSQATLCVPESMQSHVPMSFLSFFPVLISEITKVLEWSPASSLRPITCA